MVDIVDEIIRFFTTYYVDPIRNHTGYNIVNTLTYALILVVGVYYVLKLLERMDIAIDKKFIYSLLPFMVVGGTARALVDAGVYPDTFLLITPGIYVTIAVFTLVALVASKAYASRSGTEYTRPLFVSGSIVAACNVILVAANTNRPEAAAYVFGLFALFFLPVHYLSIRYESTFLGGNSYIIGAHIFDASTTFTGIQFYGYIEQHVLTGFFIDVFGPAVMFPLKIVFITLSLYLLEWIIPESEIESLNIKNILKMVIVVLGMGPGIRNLCTILMGA